MLDFLLLQKKKVVMLVSKTSKCQQRNANGYNDI